MNYQCGHSVGRHHERSDDGYPICPKCLHVERDKLQAKNAELKEELRVGKHLLAVATDKQRDLETGNVKLKKELESAWLGDG